MDLNYKEDLAIDESALDLEWLGQPALMLKYTQALAKARREVDRLKEKLSVTKAELDQKIRKRPDNFDIEKITETVIQNTIILQVDYQDDMNDLIEAQYEQQMLQGAVSAVDQKKQALENMVKLYGQQYFAGPKVSRDLEQEVIKQKSRDRSDGMVTIPSRRRKK